MQESTLGTFLSLLWTFLEVESMRRFLDRLVDFLSSMYREVRRIEFNESWRIMLVFVCQNIPNLSDTFGLGVRKATIRYSYTHLYLQSSPITEISAGVQIF